MRELATTEVAHVSFHVLINSHVITTKLIPRPLSSFNEANYDRHKCEHLIVMYTGARVSTWPIAHEHMLNTNYTWIHETIILRLIYLGIVKMADNVSGKFLKEIMLLHIPHGTIYMVKNASLNMCNWPNWYAKDASIKCFIYVLYFCGICEIMSATKW